MFCNCFVIQASALPGSQASLAVEYTLKVSALNTTVAFLGIRNSTMWSQSCVNLVFCNL